MNATLRKIATPAALAAVAAALLPSAANAASAANATSVTSAADGAATPLAAAEYTVRRTCRPPEEGHASCLAEQLVAATPQAQAYDHPIAVVRPAGAAQPALSPAAGDFGLRPQDIHSAYSLPSTGSGEPLIALVDAYNDPTAESDLRRYDETFGLSACTKANGCFKQVGEHGGEAQSSLPFPKTTAELEAAEAGDEYEKEEAEAARGWGIEETLDVQAARATCQSCRLVLVEANSTSYSDLEEAERTAESLGAQVISNSWGGPEGGITSDGPFDDPRTVITASSGDDGYLGWDAEFPEERGFTNYPASSPHVVAVGGTRLQLGSGGSWSSETVWNGSGASGGGCSSRFTAPEWQKASPQWPNVGCSGKRSVADVAADADPHSGVAITSASSACVTSGVHWCTYGGTSLASPIIAGVFGLAGGANGVEYPALTLYESRRHAPGTLHDVSEGSNGECDRGFNAKTGLSDCSASEEAKASCSGHKTCLAGKGYDGPSGVGTPDGIAGFKPGASEAGVIEEAVEAEEKEATSEKTPETPVERVLQPTPVLPVVVSSPPATTSTPPAPAPLQPAVLSRLALTTPALLALNRNRPSIAKVSFTYQLTRGVPVRVAFTRKEHLRQRTQWVSAARTLTLTGAAGRNTARLGGSIRLPAGVYRLTLTPSGGTAQSILIHIG